MCITQNVLKITTTQPLFQDANISHSNLAYKKCQWSN